MHTTNNARDLIPLKSTLRVAAEAMADSEQKTTALQLLDFARSCLDAGEFADKLKAGALLLTAAGIVWGGTAETLIAFATKVTIVVRGN